MSFTATGAKGAKDENELSKLILDAAFRADSALGPGVLESAYEACLAYELRTAGLDVGRRFLCPSATQKSVDELNPIHTAQVLSYLRLSNKKLAILINFNVVHLRHGIKRVVNGL